MLQKWKLLLINNKGFSLIEVLAAFVLLTLIIGPFFTMFLQSARTNNLSNNILSATTVAQSTMESIYHSSQTESLNQVLTSYETNDNTVAYQGEQYYMEKDKGYYVLFKLTKSDGPLVDVLIKVFDDSSFTRIKAQMENKLIWSK